MSIRPITKPPKDLYMHTELKVRRRKKENLKRKVTKSLGR